MIISSEEKEVLFNQKISDGKSKDDAKLEIERDIAFMKNKKLDDKFLRRKK